MTSISKTVKAKISIALWLLLPSVVMIIITIQALLRLFQILLKEVPVIGGLSTFIHNNALLSRAAVIYYQNTAPVAIIFLFCTLCWIAQGVFTHIYMNRSEDRVRYGAFFGLFGAVLFIVLFIAVYAPLLKDPPGFIIEKIFFFGVPVATVVSLVLSFMIFPWKEIITDEIFSILFKAKKIIENTYKQVSEFKRIGDRKIIDTNETPIIKILNATREVETSCSALLSEVNTTKKEMSEKTNISELNNLLAVANNLLSRAEKNQKEIDDIKKSIRSILIGKMDKMYADIMNLKSEMNCTFKLTNLPLYYREVNIPYIGNTNIEKVPDVLKSMIKDEKRNVQEFENIFNIVGEHLNNIKRYIEDNINALDYKKVETMIKDAEVSITNIPNELISKKLEHLYIIDNSTKYKELKLAKEKIKEAKKNICEFQFDEATQKLKEVKENIKVVNTQIEFINDLITAVKAKWDEKRISIPNPDILSDLSDEFRHAYKVKYTIHENMLKIKYETISN